MKTKDYVILISCLIFCGIAAYFSVFQKGKRAEQKTQTKTELKNTEKEIKTYKKEYDSLLAEYLKLEKKKQRIQTVYIQGKETVKYITQERIDYYTDTLCKEDVIILKSHLTQADSLINIQENLLDNCSDQLKVSTRIIAKKDGQIELYKNQKPKIKPFGIGVIGGYGTNFQNGLTPFVGVGISYNFIRF